MTYNTSMDNSILKETLNSLTYLIYLLTHLITYVQSDNTVGWATGRVSGL